MTKRISVGMITPSINKALEPVSGAIAVQIPSLSLHFSRVRVTRVGVDDEAIAPLQPEAFLEAASLLKDAAVDVIMWNGTSGSWVGLEWERKLCRIIEQETGIRASGSTLALMRAFKAMNIARYSLAVPYDAEHLQKIVDVYRNEGLECAAADTLAILDGLALAHLTRQQIEDQVRRVAVPDTQAVAIVCTNVASGWYVDELERELRVPILDSVIVTLWEAMHLCGMRPQIKGWGRLMAGV